LSLNNFNAMTYSLPALQQGLLDWAEGKPDRLSAFCTAARRAQNALMKSRPKRGDDVRDDGSEGGDEAEDAVEEEGEGEGGSEVIAADGRREKKSPRSRAKKQI
jgi:hypothetical protein